MSLKMSGLLDIEKYLLLELYIIICRGLIETASQKSYHFF